MKSVFLILFVFLSSSFLYAQELPLGYVLQFEDGFQKAGVSQELLSSKHCKAKIIKGYLFLSEEKDSLLGFYPKSAMLIDNRIFGEYIVNIKLNPKFNEPDSTSALFLILGLRDSSNYYFVEMTPKETRFCSMYKGKKQVLLSDSSLVLEDNQLTSLVLKRNILKRSITLINDGDSILFTDPNLVMGYFGLGVQDALFRVDKISIWAPTSIEVPAPVFRNSDGIKPDVP